MPAVTRAAARLGAVEMSSWRRSIQQGWRLLTAHHLGIAEEVRAAVAVLVPLASPYRGQVSSSSPETFGAVALSMPPDPLTCAVTLAHELQHLKLSALHDIARWSCPKMAVGTTRRGGLIRGRWASCSRVRMPTSVSAGSGGGSASSPVGPS